MSSDRKQVGSQGCSPLPGRKLSLACPDNLMTRPGWPASLSAGKEQAEVIRPFTVIHAHRQFIYVSLLPKLDNIIKVKKIPLMERNNYDAIQYLET